MGHYFRPVFPSLWDTGLVLPGRLSGTFYRLGGTFLSSWLGQLFVFHFFRGVNSRDILVIHLGLSTLYVSSQEGAFFET